MYSKLAVVAAMLAFAEARFGQEGTVQNVISALGNFGNPGQAATLAGASPGVLLGGANACAKKNFNPFAASIPTICSDASLPATPELHVENANSASSLANPFNADGLSVAEVAIANGFSNFTLQGLDGATAAAPAGGNNNAGNNNAGNNNAGNNNAGNNNAGNNNAGNNNAGNNNAGNNKCWQQQCRNNNAGNNNGKKNKAGKNNKAGNGNAANCGAVRTLTTVVVAARPPPRPPATPETKQQQQQQQQQQQRRRGCVPTIKFVGGLGGRPATEFTFQSLDPVIAANQQEALNPNIITNRICDELTNICAANQAAKDACLAAKAQIQALGTRNAGTAEKWNELLGFAGVDVSQN
ncbi:hypothetical protein NEMBOFW57_003971 [Staphylotrichum longicolle]|uniref:Circumsporozoite protein n=1 Tax=Staphylotrichum longicolle TaxID=669026 RepID=A0AAD4I3S2_9PEZI|nr:hypothetical protein NEMBOFW57_003971 [Staphylotrichum longicolle]